jgi:uncharacterized surface protein with fasciclin (FAS1) repeats
MSVICKQSEFGYSSVDNTREVAPTKVLTYYVVPGTIMAADIAADKVILPLA